MTHRIAALGTVALALGLASPALAAGSGGQNNHANHANHGDHADHAGHGKVKPGQGSQGQGKGKKPAAAPGGKGGNQYAGQPCPPGLAKKHPGCVPPGQWKKGDRLPEGWAGNYTAYNLLPEVFRNRYANRTDRRFVYQDGRVVVVDAASRAVVDVLTR